MQGIKRRMQPDCRTFETAVRKRRLHLRNPYSRIPTGGISLIDDGRQPAGVGVAAMNNVNGRDGNVLNVEDKVQRWSQGSQSNFGSIVYRLHQWGVINNASLGVRSAG